MTYDDDDALQNSWPESRSSVKERWSKLTDNDVNSIDGKSDHLISRLQERYGYSRERAEQECQTFLDGLETSDDTDNRSTSTPSRGESRSTERSMPSGNARASGSPSPQSGTSRSNSSNNSSNPGNTPRSGSAGGRGTDRDSGR